MNVKINFLYLIPATCYFFVFESSVHVKNWFWISLLKMISEVLGDLRRYVRSSQAVWIICS